ncbi:hypothetical protein ISF_00265 [Cordyceps fumosorosea ARSEF 2679]|uniref:Mg2+ transporter protein, CorA-like/Zinc transport protein ZntB n=1 Tax=Cordyceps fumosorosea (strain ARSEF 2679) TaxID=1081104 RepID=A0A162LNL6_CORFA|nr:hypothetical protein ISF_00265 [Cordyceps fumosorosea ARSEF 2679]OAA73364.1 hypothetical protein ISF_00265 [Cordyceps fumosorosea ARSEF 2679]
MDAASLMTAPKMHLAGILRGGNESANPYLNPDHAFHITFFEKLQARYGNEEKYYRTLIARDDLKIGHLFGTLRSGQENKSWAQRGCQQAFYRSSFTVLTISRRSENRAKASDDWYWTMLILAPPKFIQHLAEILDSIPGDIIATGQASGQTAQLSRVVYALRIIEKRWRELDEYIGDLLMEDFMDPVAYCQLLFDDSTFSRSRLYFWVLGCLNEFDPMIEDNITQWKLYREARVTPCLRSASAASSTSPSSEESSEGGPHQFDKAQDRAWFLELDQKGEQAKRDLEKVREGFEAKKKRVIALRDGLFNASALIESRSSTRLGMNVQLLTYVSIFYLPMGFCAALWAIPNITDQHTQTPFIITAVLTGLVTYLAVFNLENLAQLPGRVYGSHRKRLVQQMEQDEDQAWKGRSGGFEEFPPSAGQRRPSEWWIMRYQMLRLLRRLRTAATPCTAVVVNCFDFIRRLPSSLRRQEDSDEKKSEV